MHFESKEKPYGHSMIDIYLPFHAAANELFLTSVLNSKFTFVHLKLHQLIFICFKSANRWNDSICIVHVSYFKGLISFLERVRFNWKIFHV